MRSKMDLHPFGTPASIAALLAAAALCAGGCDTIASDFDQFSSSFIPPSPAEAAQWAADPNDRENARRGTVLLANAPWGGATPYLRLYRLYAESAPDPLVRAAALQALGRHGDPEDATLVAKSLTSPFRQVRLAAAKSLQRLHDPAVADMIWPRLVDGAEDSDVRTELAIALGQYPTPAVFQALVAALSQRDLAVNIAAVDSLRSLTGASLGLDERPWLDFYTQASEPFAGARPYLYPAYTRDLDAWDRIAFWMPETLEEAEVPIGLRVLGARRTNEASRGETPAGGSIQLPEAREEPPSR